MISLLDKAIETFKQRKKDLIYSYHDKEYYDGQKNSLNYAIRILEELKGGNTNE